MQIETYDEYVAWIMMQESIRQKELTAVEECSEGPIIKQVYAEDYFSEEVKCSFSAD